MKGNITLVELLAELGRAELSLRREDDSWLSVTGVTFPDGRQVLFVERIYRDGIVVLLDPTLEEMEIARTGDLRQLWNSDRGSLLLSAFQEIQDEGVPASLRDLG